MSSIDDLVEKVRRVSVARCNILKQRYGKANRDSRCPSGHEAAAGWGRYLLGQQCVSWSGLDVYIAWLANPGGW